MSAQFNTTCLHHKNTSRNMQYQSFSNPVCESYQSKRNNSNYLTMRGKR